MKTIFFILSLFLALHSSAQVEITIHNISGFTLDSISNPDGSLFSLQDGESKSLVYNEGVHFQGSMLFGYPSGKINGSQSLPIQRGLCGTGVELVREGKFSFDINYRKLEQGYMLTWGFPQ